MNHYIQPHNPCDLNDGNSLVTVKLMLAKPDWFDFKSVAVQIKSLVINVIGLPKENHQTISVYLTRLTIPLHQH